MIGLNRILFIYIAKRFLLSFLVAIAIICSIILLADVIELLRKTSAKNVPFHVIIAMSCYKLPHTIQEILPFAMLISSIAAFSKLTINNEITIMRSAGLSIWQITIPAAITAFLIGVFTLLVINPIGAATMSSYEKKIDKYIASKASASFFNNKSGLWLQETSKNGETIIINAQHINKDMNFDKVTFYIIDESNKFTKRIDAKKARLIDQYWHIQDANETSSSAISNYIKSVNIPSTIKTEQLQDSFLAPNTISLWNLPNFINSLNKAGFPATKHVVYFNSLLSLPIFAAVIVMLAVTFALRPPRFGKHYTVIFIGLLIGFAVYFLNNIIKAFGIAGTVPPLFAIWSPVIFIGLLSVVLLLNFEEN
jgi:lipopolysaccharide export system permease protein